MYFQEIQLMKYSEMHRYLKHFFCFFSNIVHNRIIVFNYAVKWSEVWTTLWKPSLHCEENPEACVPSAPLSLTDIACFLFFIFHNISSSFFTAFINNIAAILLSEGTFYTKTYVAGTKASDWTKRERKDSTR